MPAEVIGSWMRGEFQLITSEHILNEVGSAWRNKYWSARFSEARTRAALSLIRTGSEITPQIEDVSGSAAHPHDDPILSTAVSGTADFLVTGDRELLALGEFMSISIVTPRQFLAVLDLQNLGVDRR
jgi:putative PIN family toxin of toxin-antitoxin system